MTMAQAGPERQGARDALDGRCIDTIRMLAVDMVQRAQSGHPGTPMGAAAMAYTLWDRFLAHSPSNPQWENRDRFVLSAGHACALLYSLLYLTGYDLSLDDLKGFRQWGSKCPGHPEYGETPGVETTTGPLGQGLANAVGFALAEAHLASVYNRPPYEVVDHYTYVICGDGDLMEGVTSEAASLAGHLGLGKLIALYDDNRISIEGGTKDLAFSESVADRFKAYGWHVQRCDGNDLEALTRALHEARAERERPSIIVARTHIGYGSPEQDSAKVHGEPFSPDHYRETRRHFGFPEESPFWVPQEALSHFRRAVQEGKRREAEWRRTFESYATDYPELAARYRQAMSGKLPKGWDAEIPQFPAGESLATRDSSGKVLNAIAGHLKGYLVGGSADLAPSTKTYLSDHGDVGFHQYVGDNLHFGVREHAMGAICNGLALHGGIIPYCATFLQFLNYMAPTVRLSALMKQRVIYVYTHDSIGLGEDGPTHQPVEHLAWLRSMPEVVTFRPADANEVVVAWEVALERQHGPTAMCLSRQKLPTFDRTQYGPASGVRQGAYVLAEAPQNTAGRRVTLMASGSEVALAMQARDALAEAGIGARVVSMPSWELFEQQPSSYQQQVLPPDGTPRLAIEAASSFGWHKWVGSNGGLVTLDHFGASAPAERLYEHFGFTVERVVEEARRLVSQAAS